MDQHVRDKHKCKQCDKLFSTEVGRDSHMRQKHKEHKEIECEECKQVFINQDDFDEHYFEHYKQRVDTAKR